MAKGVKDVDKGAKALLARMRKAIPAVRVGIYGDAAAAEHKDTPGATVGEIAAAHEFGAGVPARPWLSGTVAKNKERIEAGLRKVAEAVATNAPAPPAVMMAQLGQATAGMAKEEMSNGIPPALSPAYLKRKLKKYPGASKPLIASGQMRASIASDLETK